LGKNWILLIIPIYAKVPKSLLNLSSLKEIVPKKKLSSWSCLANLHISIGNDSIVHIDLDGTGSGQSYVSITLFNTTLSFEDLSNANALIVL
jgi:hypothetical protein